MIIHQLEGRRLIVLPIAQLVGFLALFGVSIWAFPVAVEAVGVKWGMVTVGLAAFGPAYAIRGFVWVDALSDGQIKISRLFGKRRVLKDPVTHTSRENAFFYVHLVTRYERLDIIQRVFSTRQGNTRLAARVAETLGIGMSPQQHDT